MKLLLRFEDCINCIREKIFVSFVISSVLLSDQRTNAEKEFGDQFL